ncbi:TniQ family protein [Priestia megaterium]|uniref:TniQ family protein n=1 Tax=Priestia megaterium TaxID=1404 RepID=UPI0022B932ED|nr:TniQ family protein [Priestia megaterium]MCZ8494035.1 TniQ family protein [Priestia megaterium]
MKNQGMIFDELEIRLSFSPRSHYYPLEPKGIGTMYVESLTSYIARLAIEHNVSLGALLRDIMKNYLGNELVNKYSYYNYNFNLNGNNSKVEKFVEALEQKLLNNNLKYLTLIPFKQIIHGKELFKKRTQWCIKCYKEMKSKGESFHEPLIWYFAEVKICPKHLIKLIEAPYCKNCQKQQVFKRHSSIHCSGCYTKLNLYRTNKNLNVSEEELAWQLWVIKNVSELLEGAFSYQGENFGIERVFNIIDESLIKMFNNNESLFAKYLNIHSFSFLKLNCSKITFKTLLKLSYCTGINLGEIFYSPSINYNNKQPRIFPTNIAFQMSDQ